MKRRAAVLGSPIGHSLSPALHRAAYAALDLDWDYDAVECDESRLPALLVEGRRDPAWAGMSLTMPLKLTATALVDSLDETAARSMAVNTVVFAEGRARGFNTDTFGAALALRELGLPLPLDTVVVLGAGGAARGVLPALAAWQPRRVQVLSRRAEQAAALVAQVAAPAGVEASAGGWSQAGLSIRRADLVVSTVPAGAADDLVAQTWGSAALFDVLYAPWPTPLAVAARAAGAAVVGGLPMLVGQAALAVELMTGRPAPLAAMRAAGERALTRR